MEVTMLPYHADQSLPEALRELKEKYHDNYAAIAAKTGLNRTNVSQLANHGIRLKPEHENKLWAYIANKTARPDDAEAEPEPLRAAKTRVELYQTTEYKAAIGWCAFVRSERKMGVLVGPPGSGKTTVLKQFASRIFAASTMNGTS